MDPKIDQMAPGWREAFDRSAFVQNIMEATTLEQAFMNQFIAACETRFDRSTAVGEEAWEFLLEFVNRDLDEFDGFLPFLESTFPGTRWFMSRRAEDIDGGTYTTSWGVLPHGEGGVVFAQSLGEGWEPGLRVVSRWSPPLTAPDAISTQFSEVLAAYAGTDGPRAEFELRVTRDVLMTALAASIGSTPEKWAEAFRAEVYRDRWSPRQDPRRLPRIAEAVAAMRDEDPASVQGLLDSLYYRKEFVPEPASLGLEQLRDLYWALFSKDEGPPVEVFSLLQETQKRDWHDFSGALTEALLDGSNTTLEEAFVSAVRRTWFRYAPETPFQRRRRMWVEHCLELVDAEELQEFFNGRYAWRRFRPFPGAMVFLATEDGDYGVIPMGNSGVIYRTVLHGPGGIVQRWTGREQHDVLTDFIARRLGPVLGNELDPPAFRVTNHWRPLRTALERLLGDDAGKWMEALWFAGQSAWGAWQIPRSEEFGGKRSLAAVAEARGEDVDALKSFAASIVEGFSGGKPPDLTAEEFERLKWLVCACFYEHEPWSEGHEQLGT